MKRLTPLILTSALLISACGSTTKDKAATQKPAEAASATHNYKCESGEMIAATYPSDDKATVSYKGSDYAMTVAVSGSGARYVGGEMEWWTKGTGAGSEGTLFKHMADGSTGEHIERCTGS